MSTTVAQNQPFGQNDLRLRVSASALMLERAGGEGAASPIAEASLPSLTEGRGKSGPAKLSAMKALHEYLERPVDASALQRIGDHLTALAFPPPLREAFLQHFRALAPHESLRLRLHFSEGEGDGNAVPPAHLPWEFLRFDETGFLGLHPQIRLAREIPGGKDGFSAASETAVGNDAGEDFPVRVLLVSANPASPRYPYLSQLEDESESVRHILTTAPECRGRLIVETLPDATPKALRNALHSFCPHILHVIGHGDALPSGPILALCDESGVAESCLYISELARWLAATPLRLIVLSTCGAGGTTLSIARALSGVGNIVAMQLPLRDSTARQFSRAFYSALTEGGRLDDCLWQGRQAIQGAGPDWGVPVLLSVDEALCKENVLFPRQIGERPRGEIPAALPRHNLPEEERAFVGRVENIADILARFREGGARLVTITGFGGMGKTRLARRCARLLLPEFPDGVWQIELDALDSREEICSALAAALGLSGGENRASIEEISRHLAAKRLLLLFDCFERHVAQASLIEALLRAAPGVRCLVTSRIVLGLPQEFEYPLSSMTLAAPPLKTAPAKSGKRQTVAAPPAESVTLFTEAALHVSHTFAVTDENRAVIEAICQRLEGIPISLVLAAGRLRYLSPEELLDQINRRLFDTVRRRAAKTDRHASIQDVIADSFALLEPEDQFLLRQLRVFSGGFYLDDALSVCDLSPVRGDVMEGVGRLRENSLIQSVVRNGRTRHKLLDTVREYLSTPFSGDASGDSDAIPDETTLLNACRLRHSRRYLEFARELHRRMKANEWNDLAADLTLEIGNLRSAIAFCAAHEDNDAIVRFTDALARLFIQSSLWTDFDSLALAAQKAHQTANEPEMYIRFLAYRALIARSRGVETEAQELLERWLEFCRSRRDFSGAADALLELAAQARALEQSNRAGNLLEQARQTAIQGGNKNLTGRAAAQQAELAMERGDTAAARQFAADARAVLPDCRELDIVVYTSVVLGRVYRLLEDFASAEELLYTVVRRGVESADTFAISRALLELGPLHERTGQLDRAALAYLAAERIHANLDARRREQGSQALARFRRLFGGSAEVQQTFRGVRNAPWNEMAARLLAPPIIQKSGQ